MKYYIVDRTTGKVIDVYNFGQVGQAQYVSGFWQKACNEYTDMTSNGAIHYVESDKERLS